MGAITQFFSAFLSVTVIIGMYTGLYNPSRAPFVPPPVSETEVYSGEMLTLIENSTSDYVIVVAADAIPAERTAAAKLRGFLEQIGGAALEIVEDSAAPQAKELVVGDTNRHPIDHKALELGTDGFIIQTVGEKIVLAGGQPRGTLYSVYDFLEKFLGCRWLSKDMKVIPEREVVAVPKVIDEYEVPAFIYRQPTTVWPLTSIDEDYALANRINAQGMIGNSTNAEALGGIVSWPVTHSALAILPPDKYIVEHPEYFAKEEDGTPISCEHGENNPCLTNPDVIQIYIQYALDKMKDNPNLQGISMGLNDSGTICLCKDCRALYAKESNGPRFDHVDIPLAGQSRALMEVLNKVCEALEEAGHTEVTINAFAYGTATYPPNVDLHENIVIHFCPINMCYMHKPGECDYWENLYYFDEVLAGWGKIAKKITIFEYPMSYNQPGIPYPVWGVLQDYIQFYYENNVVGLTQCICTIHDVGLYVMLGYMYARLLWDPYLDMETLYRDFLPHYYGGGWQYIREYIRLASEECAGRTIGGVTYHGDCLSGSTYTGHLTMTNNEVKYTDALWAKAKELAGSQQCLDNVRRAELSFRIWKSDNFRAEFWPLNLTFSRTRSNKQLYDDIAGFGIFWHNVTDWMVRPEDFYNLRLYLLYPRMWSWRQLGRDHEGNVSNLLDLLIKSIL